MLRFQVTTAATPPLIRWRMPPVIKCVRDDRVDQRGHACGRVGMKREGTATQEKWAICSFRAVPIYYFCLGVDAYDGGWHIRVGLVCKRKDHELVIPEFLRWDTGRRQINL